uniref:Uncharacterized protein n=1 Tax=Bionectria ochroleuca TaxID=29856 RepID=A0A8H7K1E7_BIOOC
MPDNRTLERQALKMAIAGPNKTVQLNLHEAQVIYADAKEVNFSNRDVFSENTIEKDSLLMRGGVLAAKPAEEPAAKPGERPQNQSRQAPITVSVTNNTVSDGSIFIPGPLSSSDITILLSHFTEMAKFKNK